MRRRRREQVPGDADRFRTGHVLGEVVREEHVGWVGVVLVEQALEDVPPEQRAHVYAEQLKRLDQIEEMVNQISIPLSFADGLYGLRSHINFVRKRILTLMGEHPEVV